MASDTGAGYPSTAFVASQCGKSLRALTGHQRLQPQFNQGDLLPDSGQLLCQT